MYDLVDNVELLILSQRQMAQCAKKLRDAMRAYAKQQTGRIKTDLELLASVMDALYIVWKDESFHDILTTVGVAASTLDEAVAEKFKVRQNMSVEDRIDDLNRRDKKSTLPPDESLN